jgi:hypothetical protein
LGSTTGTLPIAVEVSAATVGELLSGTGQSSAKSVTRSLADSINSYHKSNATNGGIPNQVIFEFTDPAIEKAVLKKDGPTNLQATPATLAQGPADKLLDSKQSVKSTERNFSFAAGTPIIQVIDQVIRASSYITDQQNTKIDETGQVIPNPAADKPMKWFVTNGQVELKTDSNGNTAHTLTYRISPFQVNLDLPGFPPPQFRGTHKRYDYWFTGQNKEVLQFEQEHNYTYYQQTASQLGSSQIQLRTSAREQEEKVRKVAQVGSSASTQGAVAGANDIAATAAASLYSLADQAMCKIVIMGDPHWIGEYDRASAGQPPVIDYESQEILIEINFNIPSDYNLNTGLMEVNKTNYNRNSTTRTAGDPTFSFVYMATNISSTFKDGKFTQQIDGILKIFYDKVDNAAGKPATGVSGGEQPAGRAIKGGTADMFTKNKFGQSPPTIVSDITSQSLLLKVPSPTDSAFGMVGGDPLKFALPDTAPEVVKLRSGTTVEVRSVAELNQLRAQLQIDNKEYVRLRKELEN